MTLGETFSCTDKGTRKWPKSAAEMLMRKVCTASSMLPTTFTHDREKALVMRSLKKRYVHNPHWCPSSNTKIDKLREQEPLIKSYIDVLISNMREDAREGRASDVVLYFNWTAFDIVGDLSFAQSFDALKTRTTHP
jgi:hypothetical protein